MNIGLRNNHVSVQIWIKRLFPRADTTLGAKICFKAGVQIVYLLCCDVIDSHLLFYLTEST